MVMMEAVLGGMYISKIKYNNFGYGIKSLKLVTNDESAILFREENEALKSLGVKFFKVSSEHAGY